MNWIGDFVERTWPWIFIACCAISAALWTLGRYIDKRRAR